LFPAFFILSFDYVPGRHPDRRGAIAMPRDAA